MFGFRLCGEASRRVGVLVVICFWHVCPGLEVAIFVGVVVYIGVDYRNSVGNREDLLGLPWVGVCAGGVFVDSRVHARTAIPAKTVLPVRLSLSVFFLFCGGITLRQIVNSAVLRTEALPPPGD